MVPAQNDLMREEQAAAYLAISKRTLQNWRQTRKGPVFVRMSSAIRYRRAELDRYIAECAVEASR